jgi:hypothetical protein
MRWERMTGYRRWWWVTVLCAGVPSALVGLAFSPVPGLVVAAVIVIGVVVGAKVVPAAQPETTWRDLFSATVLIVAAGPALGGATLPLLMVAVATAPSLVAVVRRHVAPSRPLPGTPQAPLTSAAYDDHVCLRDLDGRALGELWRSSFVRLKSAPTSNERVVVAGLRGRLLDEMERRNRGGFAAWLARRPSPASQPGWVAAPSSEKDVPDD